MDHKSSGSAPINHSGVAIFLQTVSFQSPYYNYVLAMFNFAYLFLSTFILETKNYSKDSQTP